VLVVQRARGRGGEGHDVDGAQKLVGYGVRFGPVSSGPGSGRVLPIVRARAADREANVPLFVTSLGHRRSMDAGQGATGPSGQSRNARVTRRAWRDLPPCSQSPTAVDGRIRDHPPRAGQVWARIPQPAAPARASGWGVLAIEKFIERASSGSVSSTQTAATRS
jgi:hypothetical protein